MQGSIRDVYIGWVVEYGMEGKVIVQNGGRARAKLKNQPGRDVLAING